MNSEKCATQPTEGAGCLTSGVRRCFALPLWFGCFSSCFFPFLGPHGLKKQRGETKAAEPKAPPHSTKKPATGSEFVNQKDALKQRLGGRVSL
jgi:hypothetical protein